MPEKSKNSGVKVVKGIKPPREPGMYYRLLCMTGKNKGLSYYIRNKRIVMGRSEKADVQVLDTKSSREHAELTFVGGSYVLTDLGSQNGIIVNDLKVSQHGLVDNDKIIIGQTVFKYNQIEVEQKEIVVVDEDEDEIEEYEEEDEEEQGAKKSKKSKKDKPKKKNNMMIILVVALGAVFLLPEEDAKKKKTQGSAVGDIAQEEISIQAYNEDEVDDPEVEAKLKAYLHRGQREYREGNYYRAIEQFELALILVPNHGYATFYRQRAEEAMNKYIDKIVAKAENDIASLRYKSAVIQYCSVITFLQDSPQHPKYIEAEKKITELEAKMGVEEGEFKCF